MTSPVSAIEAKPRRFSNDRNPNGLGYSNGVVEDDHGYYVLHSDYEALARQAEALAERLKQEAQAHAMEARTANSTIYEIYQIVSGGKGEPGSWHGAEPVRAKLEALERENAELRAERRMIVSHATMGNTDGEGMSVNAVSVHITRLRNQLIEDARARSLMEKSDDQG